MTPIARLVLAAVLVGPLSAADTADAIDHQVRAQESGEKSLATTTATTAQQLDALVDEYAYNQICDPRQAAALQNVAKTLQHLATQDGGEKASTSIPQVQAQLAAAQSTDARGSALSAASVGEKAIIARFDDALQHAKQFGVLSHLQTLQAIHKLQQRLKDDTATLADATVGSSADELGVAQKVELGRLGSDQQALVPKLHDAIAQLRAPLPPDQQDPGQSARQAKAADALEQAGVDQLMQQAAGGLSDTRLEEAQQLQQRILEQLQRAERMLFDVPDIDALDELERRQQLQLDATNKLAAPISVSACAQLQSLQEELAADIRDNDDVRTAAPDAVRAATEVGATHLVPAADAMQLVIDQIRAARERLRQKTGGKLDGAAADPGGSPDGTCPASTPLWQADLDKTRNHQAWKVGLSPAARQVLTSSANTTFPSAYAQELEAYYRAIASDDQPGQP